MKKLLLILLVLGFYSLNAFSQNDEMKKWMDYMTPGKEHKELAKMDGDWTFTSKMWMDPTAPPTVSEGTATFEMILGGRYQQMKVSGKMMGMDFNGIGINGYDNAKKVWVSSWIDNFGTGMLYMEGTYDDASKKIIYKGKMFDPLTNKDTDEKQTIKIIDDKNCEMEMFTIMEGKEFKTMEIKYTKK
jgi:hypothetical protein